MPLVADFSDTVSTFSSLTPYAVKVAAAPSFSHGIASQTYTPTTATAMVAPMTSDKELQRMPEGTRLDQLREIFTPFATKAGNEATGESADVWTIDGVDFQVEQVEPWNVLGGFFRAVLRSVDT